MTEEELNQFEFRARMGEILWREAPVFLAEIRRLREREAQLTAGLRSTLHEWRFWWNAARYECQLPLEESGCEEGQEYRRLMALVGEG